MSLEQVLQVGQIGVTFLAFGGIVFGMGRITERVGGLDKSIREVRVSLFGGEDQHGMFLRRDEAKLMLDNANREHEAFDRRLNELSETVGALRERVER